MIHRSLPEPERDVLAQIAAMHDPRTTRDCVYVERGGPDLWPAGVIRADRREGYLLTTNGAKAARFVAKDLCEVTLGDMLGFPMPKQAACASGCPLVAVARVGGAVVASILTSPLNVSDAVAAAKRLSPPEAVVTVELPDAVLLERVNGLL